jgi:hypothetical protein
MRWVLASLILAGVAFLLRRLLHMGAKREPVDTFLGSLRAELHSLYLPVAQEVETQTTILGVTLNEAFAERDAGRAEMSWRIVRLARGEWQRLTELVSGMHSVLAKYLPATNGVVVDRRIAVGHFKSRAAIDNVAFYEFMDQVLFSSKQRFALQLRVLFRTCALLSKDFHRTCREGERSLDTSNELWTRLDHHFHDFDLIAKETLLAFRNLLACQTPSRAQELSSELRNLLERSTRVPASVTNQLTS